MFKDAFFCADVHLSIDAIFNFSSLFLDPGNPSLYKVGTTLGTSGR